MELEVPGANVETVEVVDEENSHAMSLEQHNLIVTNPQEILVPTSEVQVHIENQSLDGVGQSFGMASNPSVITIPVEPLPSSASQQQAQQLVGAKRPLQPDTSSPGMANQLTSPSMSEVPRKKSRNYLDSHKNIEKKRRDRINQCLNSLKSAVPDCKQYGSKKLDKAEILEMTIDYIHRLQQNQGATRGGGTQGNGVDLSLSQREWANDLTTWVIHNKLLYSGPSALDQFCQALLLHLQSMGSGNALASATSMLLNQSNASTEDESLLRQQTTSAQAALLQQLQQQAVSPTKPSAGAEVAAPAATISSSSSSSASQTAGGGGSSGLQQAQLTQLQALLLLQQQQQLLNQQQQQDSDTPSQAHVQQLQQLQQLQTLLLQHIANEATSSSSSSPTASGVTQSAVATGSTPQDKAAPPTASASTTQTLPTASSVANSNNTAEALPPTVLSPATTLDSLSLPQSEELGAPTTEETVYTSAVSESLEENLLQVGVAPTPEGGGGGGASGVTPEITDPAMEQSTAGAGQMWSAGQSLMLAGDSEGEGGESAEGKGQLMGGGQEEVQLLTQQEQ